MSTGEARARQVELDVAGAVVGLALDREGHAVDLGGDPPPVLVVDVHHGRPRLLEQPPLGREVGLHRLVEVEVVLGQVREHAAREADAATPAELERVRGDLHRARAVAGVEHPPEGGLEVDRLGRRALDLLLHPAHHALDRAEQARLAPRRLEQVADQEGGGGLAVRAGDADHLELGGRIAVEAGRRGAHRGAHVVHHHLGHAEARAAARRPAPPPRAPPRRERSRGRPSGTRARKKRAPPG